MSKLIGKTVYTVNANTNTVDTWKCNAIFPGVYRNHKERLCVLNNGAKQCILPKQFVFINKSDAERESLK